jgi:bleomycin hydrolase
VLDPLAVDRQTLYGTQALVTPYSVAAGAATWTGMDKAARLLSGDSAMNHAMLFSGVRFTNDGAVAGLRVENSWGPSSPGLASFGSARDADKYSDRTGIDPKGLLDMTTAWFRAHVFQVVVPTACLGTEARAAVDRARNPAEDDRAHVRVLPPWDPFGALAL